VALTDKGLWDERWTSGKDFSFRPDEAYVHFVQSQLFARKLPLGKKELFEVGCAPGRYLIYFDKKFGYKVSGIDFSEDGIAITKENLREHDVRRKVILGDFLDHEFSKQYDIVFSAGFIEHFSEPVSVVEKMHDIAKPGGIILATIPNFAGLLGVSRKFFDLGIYKVHNPLSIDSLSLAFSSVGLQNVEVKALGNFLLPGPVNRKLFPRLISVTCSFFNRILISLYRKSNIKLGNAYFSVQLYAYGEKEP
jgi:SAM-dependent methyltransferase